MKTFEIIQDTRSQYAKNKVIAWSNEIYNNLKQAGAIVYKEPLRELTFKDAEPCISYRVTFDIDKYGGKLTFKDMQIIVNKTKPVFFDNVQDKRKFLTFDGVFTSI